MYGGGENSQVEGSTQVDILTGTVNDSVFGGGLGQQTVVTGNVKITIGKESTSPNIGGDVYGGSALGKVNTDSESSPSTSVMMKKGTVGGSIYGGGLGNDTVAALVGPTKVEVSGGSVDYVYGCNNQNGTPKSTSVTISGGTVNYDVFGGGKVAMAIADPIVTVSGGQVRGAAYGGGALAMVRGKTQVQLTGGSVHLAYGGGLGRKAAEGVSPIEADVIGDATLTLDGCQADSIYGCNNLNGQPTGHVFVDIKKTADKGAADGYHVDAVFGGGNQAAYKPAENDSIDVLIEGCDNKIRNLYGGGNAADVIATNLVIQGGEILYSFGGGNGRGVGNPGANIGFMQDDKVIGGTARTTIHGGTIHNAYGGSDSLGYIYNKAILTIDQIPEAEGGCPMYLGRVYTAGNLADLEAPGEVNVFCIDEIDELYGGAQAADVKGNISLNVTSGKIKKVFGGNKDSGRILGSITVNIDETGCNPIEIGSLYGCGDQAAYSIFGYDADGNPNLTKVDEEYASPVINIISCTSIDTIFGGGLGESATVVGSPTININMIPGHFANRIDADGDGNEDGNFDQLGSIGTVFGGGNEAAVVGDTHVNIGTEAKNHHRYDELNEVNAGAIIKYNVYGGGLGKDGYPDDAKVTGNTYINVGRPEKK